MKLKYLLKISNKKTVWPTYCFLNFVPDYLKKQLQNISYDGLASIY